MRLYEIELSEQDLVVIDAALRIVETLEHSDEIKKRARTTREYLTDEINNIKMPEVQL